MGRRHITLKDPYHSAYMFCYMPMLNMYVSRAKVRRVGGNVLSDSTTLSPRRRRVQVRVHLAIRYLDGALGAI
jgi:hypothetical protein